ncbi:hypothetical protein ACFPM0_32435 [Pseudonocardia sulfidoxydans]|uniref:hypothetical protein n=1 Tax=Pseudonocardia sulfidoxydans TaxID=54011 RepID=UPI003611AAD8
MLAGGAGLVVIASDSRIRPITARSPGPMRRLWHRKSTVAVRSRTGSAGERTAQSRNSVARLCRSFGNSEARGEAQ